MARTPSLKELRMLSPIEWVKEERKRQDLARGVENKKPDRNMSVLIEEGGGVALEINDAVDGKRDQLEYERNMEYELIQVAAVAVKWVEMIRRGKGAEKMPL